MGGMKGLENMSETKTLFQTLRENMISTSFLVLTAFYCTLPLFIHQGLPYVDDMPFHIFQADQFTRSLHEGVLYPRWMPDFNNGYGSPNFVFYAPLSYYAVAAVHFFTDSLTVSMIIVIFLSFFFSGVTMSMAAAKIFGRMGSLLAAIIYQILPFHLRDLYMRGTFAELLAFVWFPLIFFFMHDVHESGKKGAAIGLAISYACLILTHLVSGFILTIIIGTYLIFYFFLARHKSPVKILLPLLVGLGLSSFYLLPAVFESKFVQIEYIKNSAVGDYRRNFLFTWDKFHDGLGNFYIPLLTGVVLEVMLFFFIFLLIRKTGKGGSAKPQHEVFALLFLFALILTTPLSRPIWAAVPGFPFLQFPWRWLSMVEMSLSFLVGSVFSRSEIVCLSSAKKRVAVLFIFLLFLSSVDTILRVSSAGLKSKSTIDRISRSESPVIAREYTPIWAKKILRAAGGEKISVISGESKAGAAEWESERRVISIEALTPSLIRIATFYYPGWEAELDGKKAEIQIEEDTGAMLINIPEGGHTLILRFVDTPLSFFSKTISLVSFSMLPFLAFSARRPFINQ